MDNFFLLTGIKPRFFGRPAVTLSVAGIKPRFFGHPAVTLSVAGIKPRFIGPPVVKVSVAGIKGRFFWRPAVTLNFAGIKPRFFGRPAVTLTVAVEMVTLLVPIRMGSGFQTSLCRRLYKVPRKATHNFAMSVLPPNSPFAHPSVCLYVRMIQRKYHCPHFRDNSSSKFCIYSL